MNDEPFEPDCEPQDDVLLPQEFIDGWKRRQIELRQRHQSGPDWNARWNQILVWAGAATAVVLAIAWWFR